ncbi:MAG: chromosome partitioning protein [Treponema sp.]|nr:chromosome partitioning protein [Treponema sp.]
MKQGYEDLKGLSVAEAKEYITQYITTLKLTEKRCEELDQELIKWASRVELARSRGSSALSLEAEEEAKKIETQRDILKAEIAELRDQIQNMRQYVPKLGAQERSIDPDLLEQELLITLGEMPGEDTKAETDYRFEEAEADAALEALKAKMRRDSQDEVI